MYAHLAVFKDTPPPLNLPLPKGEGEDLGGGGVASCVAKPTNSGQLYENFGKLSKKGQRYAVL